MNTFCARLQYANDGRQSHTKVYKRGPLEPLINDADDLVLVPHDESLRTELLSLICLDLLSCPHIEIGLFFTFGAFFCKNFLLSLSSHYPPSVANMAWPNPFRRRTPNTRESVLSHANAKSSLDID